MFEIFDINLIFWNMNLTVKITWDVPCTIVSSLTDEVAVAVGGGDVNIRLESFIEAAEADKWPPFGGWDWVGVTGTPTADDGVPTGSLASADVIWAAAAAAAAWAACCQHISAGPPRPGCGGPKAEDDCWLDETFLLVAFLLVCLRVPWTLAKSITSLCLALKWRVKWHLLPRSPHRVHSRVRPRCWISSPSSMGIRYLLISGYWAFDLRFRRRHRNWGEDFLLVFVGVDVAVGVPIVVVVDVAVDEAVDEADGGCWGCCWG